LGQEHVSVPIQGHHICVSGHNQVVDFHRFISFSCLCYKV
jgi:hypothetical protein